MPNDSESGSSWTRARFKQPKSRTHVVRTEMEMIETGKKSTEANIDAALAELVDAEARWADVPLSGRASLLKQVADKWFATRSYPLLRRVGA
jgi:acyl-CoA reductase-like NAD-dependent aldehyde dehydrogenase